jgi:SagB-type dehydrogenase family enzyme
MSRAPRTYEDLTRPPPWPLSRLYHEDSSLTERRAMELREQIERFSDDDGALPAGPKVYPTRPATPLPRARRKLFGARLDDTLRARRTQRGPFAGGPVPLAELGALLDLALGVTATGAKGDKALDGGGAGRDSGAGQTVDLRAYPSAGALYPLETYVLALDCPPLEQAAFHHDPHRRVLARVAACPPLPDLGRMIFADDLWQGAAAALVFTGVFARTQAKYGERGYRFVLLEAGHAAQNVLLAAAGLGLAAAPIGGFCEGALGAALGLDANVESPVYVVLLGR